MTKLTDTQLVLLSHAAQQGNGSLFPPPTTITTPRAALDKSIVALIKRGFAEEGEIADAAAAWRQQGDTCFGARITDAGRKALGLANELRESTEVSAVVTPAEKKQSKAGLVLELLRRAEGATLQELVTATGWLPHTTRAALTGLRKKGHQIAKGKRGDMTYYSVATKA